MKRLTVPFLEEINNVPLNQLSQLLESKGTNIPVEQLNWPLQFSYRPITTVYLAANQHQLCLLFQVYSNCLKAVHTHDNDPVHEDSCVEFFVKQPGSEFYYNFEFNCIGVCKAARHYQTRENATDFSKEQLQRIKRWSSIGNRPFSEMEGLFNWQLCITIPFTLMDIAPDIEPEKLLGNFYKCADGTAYKHYVSWSPIFTPAPDFHQPDFFGEIYLNTHQV
jgi:hypothetical protein